MKSQINYNTILEITVSLEQISNVANRIISYLPNSAIVALNGDLAAGKTTLVSSIVQILNLGQVVSSPTFSLQNIYSNKLFHYDFYRLNYSEIMQLGLIDELEKDGLHFIEWAPKELIALLENAGFEIFIIDIEKVDNSRKYKLKVLNA